MHPLAAPGTLWVISRVGKYLVRPQAGETSHKKQISCGRQGKRAPLLFSVSQRVSPLRRRPKGFPIALWKPSGPLAAKGGAGGTAFLWKARERAFLARGFRLCGGDQGAFRSPFGNLRRPPVEADGSHKKQISCGGQGKRAFLSFFCFSGAFASAEATRGLSDRPLDPFGEFLSQTEPYSSAVFMHIGQKIPKQQTNLPCPISCITLVKI